MPQVKFLAAVFHRGSQIHGAGETKEVADEEAAKFIRRGWAEPHVADETEKTEPRAKDSGKKKAV